MIKILKGQKVFEKGKASEDGMFYVLLSTDIKDTANKKSYMANTIIEEMKIYKSQTVTFSEDFFAVGEGYLGKAKIQNKKAELNE